MNFQQLKSLVYASFRKATVVKPSHWQGVNISDRPDMETYELLNHSSTLNLPSMRLDYYRNDIQPDLPWADDHFEERVCGYPLNPGTQWAKWRLNAKASLDPDGRFNHNYMERIWPKYARKVPPSMTPQEIPPGLTPHRGILYEYGDLMDVVNLLRREPLNRQAYLPMFFPEDTGTVHGGRAPCSLGWQFIVRDNKLHCTYFLRSCDVINHWHNDIYLAIRLMLWVLEQLRPDPFWDSVTLGTLTTHITSFHCFSGNFHLIEND